jgi:hypothetical protein
MMRISRTDVRGFDCPACGATAGKACQGVRRLRNGRPWERMACHQERWQVAEANAEVLTIDTDGNLANSSGDVIGCVIELTLDISAARLRGGGGHGAVSVDPSRSDSGTTKRNAHASASNAAVTRIWAHYQRVIPGASRQTLDATRTTIIRNALKIRTEAECVAAINGLAHSPHHNGQNDRRKKYLGLRYALAGIGKESTDERIDKMARLAAPSVTGADASIPSAAREMVRTRQHLVEDMLLNPGDADRRARAGDSERYLRETWGLQPHAITDGEGVPGIRWDRIKR